MRIKNASKDAISDPLQRLLSMPLAERIAAVAKDVRARKDQFRQVNAHKLAEALGVAESHRPACLAGSWTFTIYANKRRLEEYADGSDAISELVYLIKDKVPAKRFNTLVKKSATLVDYSAMPQFGFLTAKERKLIEEGIAAEDLKRNSENGMCCLAHYSVAASDGDLRFEAVVEDDGACIDLKTPYDDRDGKFTNLENCVTESY